METTVYVIYIYIYIFFFSQNLLILLLIDPLPLRSDSAGEQYKSDIFLFHQDLASSACIQKQQQQGDGSVVDCGGVQWHRPASLDQGYDLIQKLQGQDFRLVSGNTTAGRTYVTCMDHLDQAP